MTALLIGYARVSTDEQDLTSQRDALAALGVSPERTYVDHGRTGTNRERSGLREALAACRAGDTFVVTKLDRLARSLPDAREIIDDLTRRQVTLSLGGQLHDPTAPIGRCCSNVLAMVAEFESDLIRLRSATRWASRRGLSLGCLPRNRPLALATFMPSRVGRSTVDRALEREAARHRPSQQAG
jgi:DNA invertase Pin-like site-specific DNA recombinase